MNSISQGVFVVGSIQENLDLTCVANKRSSRGGLWNLRERLYQNVIFTCIGSAAHIVPPDVRRIHEIIKSTQNIVLTIRLKINYHPFTFLEHDFSFTFNWRQQKFHAFWLVSRPQIFYFQTSQKRFPSVSWTFFKTFFFFSFVKIFLFFYHMFFKHRWNISHKVIFLEVPRQKNSHVGIWT